MGVQALSAAAVNERIRVREGVGGTIVVVGAWCRSCRQESSANERGECLFCGRRIVDEDRLSSKELRTILELQALGFTDGLAAGVHIVVPEEPHEQARKLLATLGATYEVRNGDHSPHLTAVGEIEPERTDGRRSKWTRETMIPAVQAWAREHGRPPTLKEGRSDPSIPNPNRAAYVFGSWGSLIEQAGFERPVQGRRLRKDSSGQTPAGRPVSEETTAAPDEQEPPAAATAAAAPLAEVAQPERAPAHPAGDAGSTPALRSAALGVLDALRVLVDTAFPEERS